MKQYPGVVDTGIIKNALNTDPRYVRTYLCIGLHNMCILLYRSGSQQVDMLHVAFMARNVKYALTSRNKNIVQYLLNVFHSQQLYTT